MIKILSVEYTNDMKLIVFLYLQANISFVTNTSDNTVEIKSVKYLMIKNGFQSENFKAFDRHSTLLNRIIGLVSLMALPFTDRVRRFRMCSSTLVILLCKLTSTLN